MRIVATLAGVYGEDVWAAITRSLDRLAIRSACRSVAFETGAAGRRDSERIEHPDYFAEIPEVSAVFGEGGRFVLSSPFPSPWKENNRVPGRIFPARKRDSESKAPAVLLLHGWNGEQGYRYLFPLLARRLQQLGVTAAMIELPYHATRKPRSGRLRNFLSGDLAHMMAATRQAVGDIRATLRWLAESGHGPVGLWGVSLGAWLGGLVCSAETDLGAAVLVTPVARLEDAIAELDFCRHIRANLAESPLTAETLNLGAHLPKLPPDRILLVEAIHDLFASAESVEALWERWQKPEIWRVRHGHISVLFSPVMNRTARWLSRRLREQRP